MPKEILPQLITTIDDAQHTAEPQRRKLAVVVYLLAQALLAASELLVKSEPRRRV
jgi:hypothetical protein